MKIHAIQTGTVRIKSSQRLGRGRGVLRQINILLDRTWTEPLPIYIWAIVLARYAREWLLGIEDVSEFVREQRQHARSPFDRLITPREEVYPVTDPEVAARLGLAAWGP